MESLPGQYTEHSLRFVLLHAPKNWHGTPKFWHRTDNFWVWHCQLSPCKRMGPEKKWALVPQIVRVPRLPPGDSLGTCKSRHGAENEDLYAVQDQFCCGYNQGTSVAYPLHSRQ